MRTGSVYPPAMASFKFSSSAMDGPPNGVLVANTTHRPLVVSLTLNVLLASLGTITFQWGAAPHTIKLDRAGYYGIVTLEVGPGGRLSIALEGTIPHCGVEILSVTPV